MKIVHIITGLSTGGAEMMLYKLLSGMDTSFNAEVISLTDIGPVGEKIRELGIPVRALGMKRGIPSLSALLKLTRWLRQASPHVVQTWMYHSDLIGGLAAKLAGGISVVWGIRHSNLSPEVNKRSTILTAKLCARLSRWLPKRIICCSEASSRVHIELGYAAEKMVVIPNGFDMDIFRPDSAARQSVRQELGISDQAIIVGLIGRFDSQKDHYNFIQAAAQVWPRVPDVYFLLCGDGITWENSQLVKWIDEFDLHSQFHLLGRRNDTSRIFAAVDIVASSSIGEGFPNVLGEAMACGIPCAVTDVGDSALIVGETGMVVPPSNPPALAEALVELINLSPEGRNRLGIAARQHVKDKFSLATIISLYEGLYKKLL